MLLLPFLKLSDKPRIWIDFIPFLLNMLERLLKAHTFVFYQIGEDKSNGTRYSCHTMYQNIGLFPRFMNKIDSSVEVQAQVVIFVVLAWYIQGIGNMSLWML